MSKDGIANLIDFMVEDIMSLSDEEILADADPADIERAKESFARALETVTMEAMMGGPVEPDDHGKEIKPIRCICGRYAALHRIGCPFAYGVT